MGIYVTNKSFDTLFIETPVSIKAQNQCMGRFLYGNMQIKIIWFESEQLHISEYRWCAEYG